MRHRVEAVPQAPLMAFVDRHFFKFVLALLAAFGGLGVLTALGRWRELSGYEPEEIAQALASGHGYSFAGDQRWLFVRDTPDWLAKPLPQTDTAHCWRHCPGTQCSRRLSLLASSVSSRPSSAPT